MYKNYLKRTFDLIFALILMPLVLIIVTVCGVLIKLEDGGSVFYLGKRLGKDGKVFKMYKLRTMKVNAPDIRNNDGSTYNSSEDPRLTVIGKFIRKTSIDEIPQVLNVIKGDMAIVGPRPDLPEVINKYSIEQKKKITVRPGITGYSQAYFRNSIEMNTKFKNDVYYIENISLMLDIKIIFKTLTSILGRKNIYNSDLNDGNIKKVKK
ncbi:sugar transferase [Bacillus sp. EB600]|uniref:sugar transferase n=1 Tax=Bacillus sp. EB600 TaxID=2806345 RepID=UPI00210D499E|nr:sugar transferase [Bacillus sp. EB600]MCQ6280001.1 sugar transferase [Bacillus sp. EB600]